MLKCPMSNYQLKAITEDLAVYKKLSATLSCYESPASRAFLVSGYFVTWFLFFFLVFLSSV